MGLLEDAFKGWTGLAVGLGVAYVAPSVAPAIGAAVRPFAKNVIKTGLLFARSLREYTAEASEELGDLYAEARAESGETMQRHAAGARRSRAQASDSASVRRRRTPK